MTGSRDDKSTTAPSPATPTVLVVSFGLIEHETLYLGTRRTSCPAGCPPHGGPGWGCWTGSGGGGGGRNGSYHLGEQTRDRDQKGLFIQVDSKVPMHILKPSDNMAIYIKLENAFPAVNAVSAVVQSEVENIF